MGLLLSAWLPALGKPRPCGMGPAVLAPRCNAWMPYSFSVSHEFRPLFHFHPVHSRCPVFWLFFFSTRRFLRRVETAFGFMNFNNCERGRFAMKRFCASIWSYMSYPSQRNSNAVWSSERIFWAGLAIWDSGIELGGLFFSLIQVAFLNYCNGEGGLLFFIAIAIFWLTADLSPLRASCFCDLNRRNHRLYFLVMFLGLRTFFNFIIIFSYYIISGKVEFLNILLYINSRLVT